MRSLLRFLVLSGLLAVWPVPAGAAPALPITVEPGAIAIDSLYNGTDLTVTGRIAAGSQVVVRLVGEPQTNIMKQKGKVFGLLWMNLDKVVFTGAPKVFLVAASDGTPGQVLAQQGVFGLADRITVTSGTADKAALVDEFLKYQQAEKLYRENAGEISLSPDDNGSRTFRAVLHMPSRLSPGAYTVEALAVKDGTIVARGESAIAAAFVGAPAFLAEAAFDHGTLYGILASIIAIVGGLVIGQLFCGSKSGAH